MKNLTVGGLRAPGGFRGPRFQKFKKPRIQNDGPNTHPKFQHYSSIFRPPPPRVGELPPRVGEMGGVRCRGRWMYERVLAQSKKINRRGLSWPFLCKPTYKKIGVSHRKQHAAPIISQKWPRRIFAPKRWAKFWKVWKHNIPIFFKFSI